MLTTFEVCNIKCSGCASTIIKALQAEGFKDIDVDLSCEPRKVTVDTINEASQVHLKATLRKLGYPLCDEEVGFIDSASLKAKSYVSCAIGKISNNKKEN